LTIKQKENRIRSDKTWVNWMVDKVRRLLNI